MTDVEENILSLGGESGCLNEVNYNHKRGLKHELINSEPLSCLSGTLSPSGEGKYFGLRA